MEDQLGKLALEAAAQYGGPVGVLVIAGVLFVRMILKSNAELKADFGEMKTDVKVMSAEVKLEFERGADRFSRNEARIARHSEKLEKLEQSKS